jgi:diguanylate cyclase (GGDEF)-like protein/PAS domain S-box-containing protein
MFVLPELLPGASPNAQALGDAALFTLISSPFLWWLVVRPLHKVATAERTKFRKLLETAPGGIVGADREGRIVLVSAQSEALFGYSRKELLGRPVEMLLPERFREAHRGRHQSYFAAPHIPPMGLDLCGVRKDGSEFPVDMSLSLLETAAETLVIANLRDVTERKRAEHLQSALYRISEQSAAAEDLPQLFSSLHAIVGELMYNRNFYIALYDAAAGILSFPYFVDEEDAPPAPRKLGRALTEYVLRSGQPLLASPEVFADLVRRGEVQPVGAPSVDWLGVPLKSVSTTFGVLVVQSYTESVRFNEKQKEILAFVSQHVATAIERKQAEQNLRQANDRLAYSVNILERRTQEMAMLQEMGELLQSCATVEEAYGVFGRYAKRFFPAGSGALCVTAPSRNLVKAVAVWGDSPLSESVFSPDDCWALRLGHPHLVADSASAPLCRHVGQGPPTPYGCVPLMAQGEALGVLYLQVSDQGLDLPEATSKPLAEFSRLAEVVADQIGLALANLTLRETLRNQAARDPLTGVFNRRYMEESLNRDLHSAARKQRPVGVIMFDIDHFKHFNDTFGHEAGDTVLRVLGDFLQKRLRGEDIACRYGGEEFTLVLPEASLDATRQRAEQLLQEVRCLDLQHRGESLSSITLSMGVAAFPEQGLTAEDILRAADAALYRAKAAGRARVVVADKLLGTPEPRPHSNSKSALAELEAGPVPSFVPTLISPLLPPLEHRGLQVQVSGADSTHRERW